MYARTRSSELFNTQKAPSIKNWVIGWTLTEANAAAQRRSGDHRTPNKIGSLGMLAPNDRR
jgi:hypothetical protein